MSNQENSTAGNRDRKTPGAAEVRKIFVQDETGARAEREWGVIGETAIEIGFNGKPAAVMMASPSDFEDFAIGFAITEDILRDPESVEKITVRVFPEGVTVDIAAREDALQMSRLRRRLLEGRTGCGLCGIETLADAIRAPDKTVKRHSITNQAVARAFAALRERQVLNSKTHSAHAAAFADAQGAIEIIREDVGRHNALDKLIGALARCGRAASDGFFIMSSRCSFELVQKSAVAGAPMLATVSAPTTAALDLAAQTGVEIRCRDGEKIVSF